MWSITKYLIKIKDFITTHTDKIFIFLIVFLGTILVWGLLNLYQQKTPELVVEQLQMADIQTSTPTPIQIVGNKTSKIYHLPDCPGALKMNESNKIFFASILEAEQAGYRPAQNCPQLEYLK